MQWYVLRSKPNKEEPLWREVGARGHEAFYPSVCVRPVNPRARKVRPYFPGYLFVHVKLLLVGAAAFNSLPYAQGLVSFGGEPAAVPDELLAAIRLQVQEINAAGGKEFDRRVTDAHRLKAGDQVLINEGPFNSYKAIFNAHLDGSDRVRVLIQLLQARPMTVTLPAASIQPINQR
jgi:transcription antitermination factor NusG